MLESRRLTYAYSISYAHIVSVYINTTTIIHATQSLKRQPTLQHTTFIVRRGREDEFVNTYRGSGMRVTVGIVI